MTLPSAFDEMHFPMSRAFIDRKRKEFIEAHLRKSDAICDIGNQGKDIPDLDGYPLVTLDITDATGPDIVADITMTNPGISDGRFDAVLCTEVLEHVVDPFAAVREIRRITRPGGVIFFTTPLNARIHGPVPDCWRFTEFGLRVLLRDFDIVAFDKLNTPDRNLFPLHYSVIARRRAEDAPESDPRALRFSKVD